MSQGKISFWPEHICWYTTPVPCPTGAALEPRMPDKLKFSPLFREKQKICHKNLISAVLYVKGR